MVAVVVDSELPVRVDPITVLPTTISDEPPEPPDPPADAFRFTMEPDRE